jgi:hypothetical protein
LVFVRTRFVCLSNHSNELRNPALLNPADFPVHCTLKMDTPKDHPGNVVLLGRRSAILQQARQDSGLGCADDMWSPGPIFSGSRGWNYQLSAGFHGLLIISFDTLPLCELFLHAARCLQRQVINELRTCCWKQQVSASMAFNSTDSFCLHTNMFAPIHDHQIQRVSQQNYNLQTHSYTAAFGRDLQ